MPNRKSSGAARVLSSKVIHRGPVFSITLDDVEEPGGIRAKREVVHHSGSVVILAVDDSGPEPTVVLERQYRHAARAFLWELPAGRVEPGENVLAGAKRELREETGFTARRWTRMFKYYPSPGFLDETMTTYLATRLTAGTAQPESDELIRTRQMPLSEVVRMIDSGRIRDGKTIIAALWLHAHRVEERVQRGGREPISA
jgi:ADP-ribose pyrophosphatase